MTTRRGLPPLTDSIPRLIEAHARSRAEAPAVGGPEGPRVTFRELAGAIESLTGQLNDLGFGRDSRIAIVLPGGPELAVTVLGVAAAAMAVPLDPRLTAAEVGARVAALGVEAVLVARGLASPARAAARAAGVPVLERSSRPNDPAGLLSLRGAVRRPPARAGYATPEDVALVLQTSGTTGAPKAVRLRHRQLCMSGRHVAHALALMPDDRCLNIMPLFHVHGLVGALLASLTAGSSVICAPGFSALRFRAWAEAARPTWYTAVPAMHRAIARLAERSGRGLARLRLRLVRSSSAPLAPPLMAELERLFEAPVIEAYGMTEATHQIASNPLPPAPRKPGSVGLPVGVEVAIRDEAGHRLGHGKVGEVTIRGQTVSLDESPDRPAEGSPRGWLRTGDLGFLDADGYLFLAGRLGEAINRGGEKILPSEVDAALLDHPAVADAVTVPVPDPDLGEDVGAVVVLRRGASVSAGEIRRFVAERVAAFKVPRRLELVGTIPRGVTGKIARRKLGAALTTAGTSPPADGAMPVQTTLSRGSPLLERLLAFARQHLAERRGFPGSSLTAESSLIRSGLFDSLALVDLVEWVEREAGRRLEAAETQRLADCDTVHDIVRFLEVRRSKTPTGSRRAPRIETTLPRNRGYRFEPYRPEWRESLLRLQQHHWSPDADLNAALFEWKYEKNPYADEPLVYVALHGDEVVGMRGFCGGLWQIGRRPQTFPALAGGDLVVSPIHRNRGLVHGIMRRAHTDLARRGFQVLLSFTAGRASYLASLSTGWHPVASLGGLCRRDARRPPAIGDDVFAELDRTPGRAKRGPVSVDRAPRPAAMLSLLERTRRDPRLAHVRDERYLAWRFGNPMSRHRFLFWEEGSAQGYLVLQTPLHPGRGSRVNVLEWAATSSRVRNGLLRCAVEGGAFPEVRLWAASVGARTRCFLEELGFQVAGDPGGARRHPSTVLVRLLGRRAEAHRGWVIGGRSLKDPASWNLRMAYSDAV